ncbi:hypothetical protein HNO89_003711 [Sporosarcina luteola]|nr:hypothetical protein [Sporosarcina luteola]
MKIVIFESISKIIITIVFAYSMDVAFREIWLIDAFERAYAEGRYNPVHVELNLFPFALCFLLVIIYMVMSKRLKPRKKTDILMKIGEFQDADERERLITNRAARTSYMVASTGGVIAMILMVFSTTIIYRVPSFPIYLFALILITSAIAYAITWCLEFNK